jgi:hypothetical protein
VVHWLTNDQAVIGSGENITQLSKTFASAYLELLDGMGTAFWWLDDHPAWIARLTAPSPQQLTQIYIND